jgi:ribosomal protein L13E
MLETLDVAIEEARRKVESGRVYDAENEKVRIKWIRALAYAVNVRRQITNDRTLEELSERIEQLEASREGQR